MKDDLLLRLIRRGLEIPESAARGLAEGDARSLATLLAAAPPDKVAAFLDAVRASLLEEQQRLERLNRALQRKTGEVRNNECRLERQVAEERLIERAVEAVRTADDFGQAIRTCLEAVCDLSGWPAAYAWIPEGIEPVGFTPAPPASGGIWVVREDRLRDRFPHAAAVIAQFRTAWEEGRGCTEEMKAAGFRVGLALPLSIEGQLAAVIEVFSWDRKPVNRRTLSLIRHLGRRIGEILEHRRADLQRTRQRALLNALLDLSPTGIMVVDPAGRMILANSRLADQWNIPAAILESRSEERILEHMQPQVTTPEAFLDRVRELDANPDGEGSDELDLIDGRVFQRWTLPVRVQGATAARVWVFLDITARRQAERERARVAEQLRQAQKMETIGQIAGGVAHDFNNVLTVMMGYAQIALMRLDPEDGLRTPIREICRAGNRATALAQQLLAFSRRQVLAPKVLDLGESVDAMVPMLKRLVGENVELVLRVPEDPARIMADPSQVEQVLMNLAINARDAMPDGGRLTVSIGRQDVEIAGGQCPGLLPAEQWIVLTVADTGTGMNEETQARIFEPFFTTKDPGKGTGLGLPTVHGIVTQGGGRIELDSAPGRGATFHIYLPSVDQPAEQARPDSGLKELAAGLETILVVEDEEMVRELARDVLHVAGYTVLEASSGPDALQVSESHEGPIHLVLSDVIMPQMNGRETYERLVRQRPDLKVLYMSGYTDDVFSREGPLDPGVAFIQKPFKLAALTARVREVLDEARERAA